MRAVLVVFVEETLQYITHWQEMCVKGSKDNANGLEIYKPMSPNGQTCKYVVESYKYERVNETPNS